MLTATAPKPRIPLLEAGVYTAVCSMVIDLGTQYNEAFNKTEQKVRLVWEIPGETVEIDGQQQPRQIFKDFTVSLHEQSTLRKMLQSWRGKAFTPEELQRFDLPNLLGVGCQLQLIHKDSERGNTYGAVENIMALPKGSPKPKATKTACFDLDDPATYGVFETLPRYTQEKIAQAQNFEATGLELPERTPYGAAPREQTACGDFEEIITDDDAPAF